MKTIDLKLGTDTFQNESGDTEQKDNYPYGTRISLGTEEMKKLGIPLPKVGEVFTVVGVAKVISTHSSESESDEEQRVNVELQLTSLGLDAESKKSAADVLYGAEE